MQSQQSARIDAAVTELQELIRKHYPDAIFSVEPGEAPPGSYITATVDVDDLDTVFRVVAERLLEMQVYGHIPVYVNPVRPVERVISELHTKAVMGALAATELMTPLERTRSAHDTGHVHVQIDTNDVHQEIDGFGVNINPVEHWKDGALRPVLDLLVDDLGATIFRLDPFGFTNWIDPNGTAGPSSLNPETYARIYRSGPFRDSWETARHLNARGAEILLNVSGVVPSWMCAADGETLVDLDVLRRAPHLPGALGARGGRDPVPALRTVQ